MGDLSPHFSRHEFACPCGCGYDTADAELLVMLETIRQNFGAAVVITERGGGCRCPAYNAEAGGGERSQHLIAKAADIVVDDVPAADVQAYCERVWPDKYGIGSYEHFTHIDSRNKKARWSG